MCRPVQSVQFLSGKKMQRYQPLCSLECPCSSGRSTGGCNVVERLHISLSKFFGLSNFRTGQKESALSALHGRDVFLRIATGGGKSLSMFLVPLTYSNQAIGVIISPLNSLMDEQVNSYRHHCWTDVCSNYRFRS